MRVGAARRKRCFSLKLEPSGTAGDRASLNVRESRSPPSTWRGAFPRAQQPLLQTAAAPPQQNVRLGWRIHAFDRARVVRRLRRIEERSKRQSSNRYHRNRAPSPFEFSDAVNCASRRAASS